MTKKKVNKKHEESKVKAWVTAFLSIIGFIIALLAWRDDKYVMFYAKQSFVVFIVAVLAGLIQGVFVWIPILGWIINVALSVLVFILWLFSWIYALSGEMKLVPLVGEWGNKIKL